jgi:peptidoglycan hydrolase-like protein with peptidoglycan-binding domain
MVARRVRSYSVIAGFGRPEYTAPKPITPPKPGTSSARWPYKAGTLMRRGWSNSEGVKAVQRRLNELGAKPRLTVDGDYGPSTEAAVRLFQKTHRLEVDGICGPRTWGKLFEGK